MLASLAVEAQQARKVPRVGFLVLARNPGVEDSFPRGLRDLGYVEGRDVPIEWRSAEGRSDRVEALAVELVELGVDVPGCRWSRSQGSGDGGDDVYPGGCRRRN